MLINVSFIFIINFQPTVKESGPWRNVPMIKIKCLSLKYPNSLFVLTIFEIILANVEAVPMMKVEKVKEEK